MLAYAEKQTGPMNQIETHCVACGTPLESPVQITVGVLCRSCGSQGLFRKRIIITGITRMNRGHVCVSGIDPDTMRFVRPVFASGLDRDFIMEGTTQVIRHFNLVEMEFRKYMPSPEYHTEDWLLNENFAPCFIRQLTAGEVSRLLARTSVNDLSLAFAPKNRSLFNVKARRILNIWHEQYEKFKVRLSFEDAAGNLYDRVPVSDLLTLNFVKYQLSRGNTHYAGDLIPRFNSNPDKYVRIGLTRQWQGRYWKQVTALITVPDLFGGNGFAHYEQKMGGRA